MGVLWVCILEVRLALYLRHLRNVSDLASWNETTYTTPACSCGKGDFRTWRNKTREPQGILVWVHRQNNSRGSIKGPRPTPRFNVTDCVEGVSARLPMAWRGGSLTGSDGLHSASSRCTACRRIDASAMDDIGDGPRSAIECRRRFGRESLNDHLACCVCTEPGV